MREREGGRQILYIEGRREERKERERDGAEGGSEGEGEGEGEGERVSGRKRGRTEGEGEKESGRKRGRTEGEKESVSVCIARRERATLEQEMLLKCRVYTHKQLVNVYTVAKKDEVYTIVCVHSGIVYTSLSLSLPLPSSFSLPPSLPLSLSPSPSPTRATSLSSMHSMRSSGLREWRFMLSLLSRKTWPRK